MSERRAARCSCSWKAESSSPSGTRGGPEAIFRDLVPGRIRRGVAEELGAITAALGFAVGGIWTSVRGGGECRRGEAEGLSEVDEEAIFVFDGPNDIR